MSAIILGLTFIDPIETLRVTIDENPIIWPATAVLLTTIIHLPVVLTILLSILVFLGTIGAVAAGVVTMSLHPHCYSKDDQKIWYALWEIGVLIPVVMLLWMNRYGPASAVWYLEPVLVGEFISVPGYVIFWLGCVVCYTYHI